MNGTQEVGRRGYCPFTLDGVWPGTCAWCGHDDYQHGEDCRVLEWAKEN